MRRLISLGVCLIVGVELLALIVYPPPSIVNCPLSATSVATAVAVKEAVIAMV